MDDQARALAERLRRGANLLIDSGGDAADALFAAELGVTVVRGVLDAVRAQQQALLADSGKKGDIHVAVQAHDAARAALRSATAMEAGHDERIAQRTQLRRDLEALAAERAGAQAAVQNSTRRRAAQQGC